MFSLITNPDLAIMLDKTYVVVDDFVLLLFCLLDSMFTDCHHLRSGPKSLGGPVLGDKGTAVWATLIEFLSEL